MHRPGTPPRRPNTGGSPSGLTRGDGGPDTGAAAGPTAAGRWAGRAVFTDPPYTPEGVALFPGAAATSMSAGRRPGSWLARALLALNADRLAVLGRTTTPSPREGR